MNCVLSLCACRGHFGAHPLESQEIWWWCNKKILVHNSFFERNSKILLHKIKPHLSYSCAIFTLKVILQQGLLCFYFMRLSRSFRQLDRFLWEGMEVSFICILDEEKKLHFMLQDLRSTSASQSGLLACRWLTSNPIVLVCRVHILVTEGAKVTCFPVILMLACDRWSKTIILRTAGIIYSFKPD